MINHSAMLATNADKIWRAALTAFGEATRIAVDALSFFTLIRMTSFSYPDAF